MNQVQVFPFETKLCQNIATASRTPLEPLLSPETRKKMQKSEIPKLPFPVLSPLFALLALYWAAALWGAPLVEFTLVAGSVFACYSSKDLHITQTH